MWEYWHQIVFNFTTTTTIISRARPRVNSPAWTDTDLVCVRHQRCNDSSTASMYRFIFLWANYIDLCSASWPLERHISIFHQGSKSTVWILGNNMLLFFVVALLMIKRLNAAWFSLPVYDIIAARQQTKHSMAVGRGEACGGEIIEPPLLSGVWKYFCKDGDVLNKLLTVDRICKVRVKCQQQHSITLYYFQPTAEILAALTELLLKIWVLEIRAEKVNLLLIQPEVLVALNAFAIDCLFFDIRN